MICHIFHLGMSGNRKTGLGGVGCSCKINLLDLDNNLHSILDGRQICPLVEQYKIDHKEELNEQPKNYRRLIAFGVVYRYYPQILDAIQHHQARNQGLTYCTKLCKKSGVKNVKDRIKRPRRAGHYTKR